jgi:hypothetical protein
VPAVSLFFPRRDPKSRAGGEPAGDPGFVLASTFMFASENCVEDASGKTPAGAKPLK